jgi:alkylated DNA nucleotide flippase Atl1
MPDLSFLKKLETAPAASFIVLEPVKSRRMGGVKTLYIPSVAQVAEIIKAIPSGETRTIEELRAALAKIGKADTACPAKTIKYWKWMASIADEVKIANPVYDIPWWRVLKDGKPSRHMPGGIENQKLLLKRENVILK